jgi:hypothetical protein
VILSIEGGLVENVGKEVLVPDQTVSANVVRTLRDHRDAGLEKPMPANGAGTAARNKSVI